MAAPELLQRLLTASGPSGHEEEASAIWREAASQFADVTSDTLGSFAVRGTTSSLINDPFDLFAPLDPLRPQGFVVTFGDSNTIERSSAGRQPPVVRG